MAFKNPGRILCVPLEVEQYSGNPFTASESVSAYGLNSSLIIGFNPPRPHFLRNYNGTHIRALKGHYGKSNAALSHYCGPQYDTPVSDTDFLNIALFE